MVGVLAMAVREAEGKNATPTVAIVDSQSVKTTEAGGERGYDAGKKVKGRKRHLALDTLGLPIKCQVTPADVQDRDALAALLAAVSRKSPWIKRAFVDGGYAGDETARAAFEASKIRIQMVRRPERAVITVADNLTTPSWLMAWCRSCLPVRVLTEPVRQREPRDRHHADTGPFASPARMPTLR